MLIINAIVLNILSGAMLFALARMYERRIFIPAENDAQRLEEHEQFNRKIVASAPVGICILRTLDGTNILSNELAHNYLNMLTHEDRQRLTQIICGQQVNFVDVLTSNHTNLQISFVHSRYRNENVAICVLVDVSARVKMEESLQEMARAAEQASQSKSMFLATVSHELRTPLYGIIGNLDLLQTKALPKGVDRPGDGDEQLLEPAAENHQRYSRFLQNRVRAVEDRAAGIFPARGHEPYLRQLSAAGGAQAAGSVLLYRTGRSGTDVRRPDASAAGDLKPAEQCDQVHRHRLHYPARSVRRRLSAD